MREREIIAGAKKLHDEQASPEEIVQFLRAQKATKVNSIRLLHLGTGMSLRDAKRIVFQSATWSDRKESDDAFVDALLDGVKSSHNVAA